MKNLAIVELRIVGNGGKHLKLKLKEPGGKIFSAIGFGLGEYEKTLAIGASVDAIFELEANEWNGNRELQLKIIDLKLAS